MLGEERYQQEALTALLIWTMRVGPIAALLNMIGFFVDPAWTTIVGSAGVVVLVVFAWWCLKLAKQGLVRRAARAFNINGMCIMAAVVFIAARNEVLLGAMGMGVFVVIATFFEPPESAMRWGILSGLLYEAGIIARSLDPSRDLGVRVDVVSLYIVPPVILCFLALAGRIVNEHLRHALRASEEAGRDLARSYAEVEQRVAERTSDLVAERNRLAATMRELAAARDAAEAASRAKSAFLANMSHELRTPLTTILGYTGLIEHHEQIAADARLLSDLERISAAGNHLLDLINDVLDLARIEAGNMAPHPEPFDIAGLIDESVSAVRPALAKNNNRLEIDVGHAPAEICLDRTKVRQILNNLLSNATKFTDNGTITLRVSSEFLVLSSELGRASAETQNSTLKTQNWVVLEVSDTGIGIAPDQLPALFQPFTKGYSDGGRLYDGTGLGLAICRRLCELMGGELTVSSQPGQGSTFTVRLPVAPTSAASAVTTLASDCSR